MPEERLVEPAYSVLIMALLELYDFEDVDSTEEVMKMLVDTWPLTREDYGTSSLRELVKIEVHDLPRCRRLYQGLSYWQRIIFWRKVRALEKVLNKSKEYNRSRPNMQAEN